jgi:hypothetical protein
MALHLHGLFTARAVHQHGLFTAVLFTSLIRSEVSHKRELLMSGMRFGHISA